ncbi:MAG: pyridoxal-phosphate dependent enzyme [Planctomycetes bacterium]|nr:pyridoxal-phosphate dependent enzyme [Planctomycetota bacterium]MCW8136967.1 pyridoxal-phosphate dependent enzyme [Planctomycetota bacterium]
MNEACIPLPHPFALLRALPNMDVPHVRLGDYPTAMEHLPALGDVWLKREDASSAIYGGNKIRTLETLLGDALAKGTRRVWTLGAFGSNQALALILHAESLHMQPAAVLFPQRATPTAAENLRATLSHGRAICLRSIATFPAHWWRLKRNHPREYLITPGGAVPLGALGHVGAALEIAEQVGRGDMPPPAHIILAIGSTCTTAGLLAGIALARKIEAWPWDLPTIHAVRVTPWPVTSRAMILRLARATAREIPARGGPAVEIMPSMLRLHTRYFGWGYARITRAGIQAAEKFRVLGAPPLDTTYAAKSGAMLLDFADLPGPKLFWCTKSSAPLPPDDPEKLAGVPAFIKRWLKRAQSNASAS